jgi:cyclic beta-1,2-glucan synthetase
MMIRSSVLDLMSAELDSARPAANVMPENTNTLGATASDLARRLYWAPGQRESRVLQDRCRDLFQEFKPLLAALETAPAKNAPGDCQILHENILLLKAELDAVRVAFNGPSHLPQVRIPDSTIVPRIAAIADDFLIAVSHQFSVESFVHYIEAFQGITALNLAELWGLIPALELVLLEQIAERGHSLLQDPIQSYGLAVPIRSLQRIKQTAWKVVIEPLIRFDRFLREDPSGTYSRMDYESREQYRNRVVNISKRSERTEMEVASEALALAREAHNHADNDPRLTQRRSHIGNYLIAEGVPLLERRVDFRAPFFERMRTLLRTRPDEFFLPGIALLTFAIVSIVVLFLTEASTSLGLILLATLAVLLPSSQSAVQIVNYLVTLLLPAQTLPKLDFSDALPDDCISLVSIPTLLLNEKQVRKLADDLEVRFLGNQDPNLHFALLTDLPDSLEEPQKESPLVDLAADLIRELNEKYAPKRMGSFFLFHRHRVYNPRERLWMGWERKRGKLMDLNNLLRGQFDSFPRKVGNLSLLPQIRFVITLDSDTELPRGSARRMVGTLAHPLNQAIISPETSVVVDGYGILQPRVGVSVQSSAQSRLASIYSGQTGVDIYTHASSDVYQDLYGEGIFVGKGIYEVATLHRVLDRRFPRNALLSHDLVEGAYARAGLVSDIEIIEDYPSHYSAYNRRKHRWLRGDWQITEWLLPMVPDESDRKVPNPLSVASRWKIFDNLRRSLVEPALFLLLLLGWLCLPGGSGPWTLATIAILFLPAFFQLGVELVQAAIFRKSAVVNDALDSFLNASIANWLTLTFLAHQALLSIDAVVRTLVRRWITRQRLLQWETAAEAELTGCKRTTLDIYLNWTPVLAFGVFFLVLVVRPGALPAALPILFLWACSKPISIWLNRPPRTPRKQASEDDRWLLRTAALRTWRYFAGFSTEEHNWLIPDNVQEEQTKIAPRISPTNLGLLLNARQVACTFGYLTVPELAEQTLRTFGTVSQLRRYKGHLLNWYDTRSLAPLAPEFVSSVDSGNLVASLWTLQQGCLDLLDRPLLQPELANGFMDLIYSLTSLRLLPRRRFASIRIALTGKDWLHNLLGASGAVLEEIDRHATGSKHAAEARWFQEQAQARRNQIERVVRIYTPWLLPEFAALKDDPAIPMQCPPDIGLALKRIPPFIDSLAILLDAAADSTDSGELRTFYMKLLSLLPEARSHVVDLIEDLRKIAERAGTLADEMDFRFLLSPKRELLSIGFDVEKQQLQSACYDLLASEARIAFFTAIAKDDIPQESWFKLGRAQTLDHGMAGLLSWSGTMFEYLMPALWTRVYPNTLLERSAVSAVRTQQAYAEDKGTPWGISESSCYRTDPSGNYHYFAFGVPQLAIHKPPQEGPVISPYSTFLALQVDSPAALRNLRTIGRKHALATYGFYEALDFSPSQRGFRLRRFELVRCWMAHHQGMSLLSVANFLYDDVVQNWFHRHPRVQATELLLQEKPTGHLRAPRAKAA